MVAKHLTGTALLTLTLVACTGPAATNPATPGASSIKPGAGATNGTGSPTSGTAPQAPGASVVAGPLAKIYKLGRKWVYETSTQVAGISTTVTMNQEVTKIDGTKATLSVTTDAMGTKTSNSSIIDLTGTNVADVVSQSTSKSGSNTSFTWNQGAITKESITVKAGTYDATKYTAKLAASGTNGGASATNNSESTIWTSDEVGLLKSITKGSQSQYRIQQLPGGISLPAGISLPGAGGSAPALPSLDLSFTATTELVSVTP